MIFKLMILKLYTIVLIIHYTYQKKVETLWFSFLQNSVLFDKILHAFIGPPNRKHFCQKCLTTFPTENNHSLHQDSCFEEEACKMTFPEGASSTFDTFHYKTPLRFTAYAGFECNNKPRIKIKANTTIFEQKPISHGFAISSALENI